MKLVQKCAATALIAPLAAIAQTPYPATPQRPVSDVYHGTTVVDPYRWMEDMKSPDFQSWLKAQADYAAAALAQLPGRAALRARLGELIDAGETTSGYSSVAGRVFYFRRLPGQNQRTLWWRDGVDGTAHELLDPNRIPGEPGKHAIDWYAASPDGRLVALGISKGGSEDSVLRVIDVASGKLLGESISRTGLNEGGVAWLPDGSGFAYNRHPVDERYNKSAVFLHRLGADPALDAPLFGWSVDPQRRFDIPDLPRVHLHRGSRWALAEVLHGDAAERSYWVAPIEQFKGAATPWQRVVGSADKITTAQIAGDSLYAISQKGASRRALLRLDLTQPGAAFETAMPPGESVLQQIAVGNDAVYVKALDAGVNKLWRVARSDGKVSDVKLPFEGSAGGLTPLEGSELLLRLEGWTEPPQSLLIDTRAGTTRRVNLQPAIKLDTSGLRAQRVMVKSHDGVEVPLSILSAKGVALDGRRPTILSGYGAYGIVMQPWFSAGRLAWIERGGVMAICHVRGGGELGEDWHRGGYIETKQNTVSDFIACAQWLIANRYTSPATLAGTGGSAGGITIGGAITQRPDLFAAANSAVGISDMLRMELTPNGAPNVAEFGTVTKPAHFKSMFAISPYHRVENGKPYPAVIVTTGANDPRVDAWMPGKFAARLQAANPASYKTRPVLLRVDFDAGHGMGSGVNQYLDETADVWSFYLWQFGESGFQPKP